ncbi:CDP-glycerol glycerophosphotransferase family protein [Blautia luti]|uniref:CDP-glycerol:poly(Glycerophosphate) glycerophosphotransferase n=1 Tax=Blautia luti TaxID=89014 RepID=A0A564W748_9FIRM|nr:CDP-glycerol glycerophosphotransferase family protein [Blautia luti]VUX40207.1 CDP-glycerol:poly(glycerophosphate) glycerophosphotransferase [Blautia luti]
MEQTFLEKLKRVKPGDLLHIIKFILAFPIAMVYRFFRRDLWLLCDTENECRDNGFWLYKYLRENTSEDAVYAINRKSPDYARVKDLGPVIQYGSFRHWIYYLAASKNISSQKMGKPNAAICYVLEVYGILRNKRAFLQHGIITADLSFLYYPHTKMSLFVTSTYDEWKYVNDRYGYPEGCVQELGLCRFDHLHDMKVKKNQILIMPTWRMYIRNEISASDHELEAQKFMETDYYRYWDALLKDERMIRYIEENDLQIIFYPHREMHRFLKYFHVDHPKITVASWPEYDVQTLLKESAVLVTDFSSVAMDFAYMKKPLVYYQFDNEKFRKSHHQIGYFDFRKDGFGPVCVTEQEVTDWLIRLHGQGFANEAIYLERHGKYFDLWDTKNCERNYKAIKEM